MQGAATILAKGDWVFHPRMPDWGYGKVLELIGDNKGRVLFLLAGEKKLSLEHAALGLVGGDKISQDALNDQFVEYRLKLARDILTSEGLGVGTTCVQCESLSSRCELCKGSSESLRVYCLPQRGRICLCAPCRDKIMLETSDREGIDRSLVNMEKRTKKEAADREKKKLKTVKR